MTIIEKKLETTFIWIREHQERFWTVIGVCVLAGVFVAFMIRQNNEQQDQAWTQLGEVHGHLMQNQIAETRKGLADFESRFAGSSAASYEKFMKADLLYKTSDYAGAAQVYGDLSATAKPLDLRPLALSGQNAALEMQGKWKDAQAAAQSFIAQYPDHFFAANMYLAQARALEKSNDAAAAKAVYERFIILYPQHPYGATARKKIAAR